MKCSHKRCRAVVAAFAVVLIVAAVVFVIARTWVGSRGDSSALKSVVLGYCPTMSEMAAALALGDPRIELRPAGSTAEAIALLKDGTVNAFLVGRLARGNELNGAQELRLASGHTLVGARTRLVDYGDIVEMPIHTALGRDEVERFLPEAGNVIYHDSSAAAMEAGANDAVLIRWEDSSDDYRLVIPMSDGRKIEKFRLPVIYSFEQFDKILQSPQAD